MRDNVSGQAILLVVITLAAIVTIVLSVVSRSIIDIRTTTKEEESTRAFSAAEAGIERALLSGGVTTLTDSGELENARFTASVSNFAQGQTSFVHPRELVSGDTATVWMVSHDNNGNLICSGSLPCFSGSQMRICWGNSANIGASTPAIEVSVIYDPDANGNYNNIRITRATYDPNPGRRGSNAFAASSGGCTIGGKNFAFSATVNFSSVGVPASSYGSQNGLQMVNIRSLYNSLTAETFGVDVTGSGLLPGQGKRIESTGSSGEATRKVEVFSLYADVPAIFQSAIFTPGSITK